MYFFGALSHDQNILLNVVTSLDNDDVRRRGQSYQQRQFRNGWLHRLDSVRQHRIQLGRQSDPAFRDLWGIFRPYSCKWKWRDQTVIRYSDWWNLQFGFLASGWSRFSVGYETQFFRSIDNRQRYHQSAFFNWRPSFFLQEFCSVIYRG